MGYGTRALDARPRRLGCGDFCRHFCRRDAGSCARLAAGDRRRDAIRHLGVPVVLAAAVAAASLAFLIARYLLRQRVRVLLANKREFAAIDNAVAEEGWKIVFLLRLSPLVPF